MRRSVTARITGTQKTKYLNRKGGTGNLGLYVFSGGGQDAAEGVFIKKSEYSTFSSSS
jgi:hypothetical protein